MDPKGIFDVRELELSSCQLSPSDWHHPQSVKGYPEITRPLGNILLVSQLPCGCRLACAGSSDFAASAAPACNAG